MLTQTKGSSRLKGEKRHFQHRTSFSHREPNYRSSKSRPTFVVGIRQPVFSTFNCFSSWSFFFWSSHSSINFLKVLCNCLIDLELNSKQKNINQFHFQEKLIMQSGLPIVAGCLPVLIARAKGWASRSESWLLDPKLEHSLSRMTLS